MALAYKVAIKVIDITDGSEVFINFSQPGLSTLVKVLISFI